MCVYTQPLSRIRLFVMPWTSVSMGFSRQEYWSGSPFPSPGESSQPRDWTCVSCVYCIGRWFFTTVSPGKPYMWQFCAIGNWVRVLWKGQCLGQLCLDGKRNKFVRPLALPSDPPFFWSPLFFFLAFYFVLEYSWSPMHSRATQPYIYMIPFFATSFPHVVEHGEWDISLIW